MTKQVYDLAVRTFHLAKRIRLYETSMIRHLTHYLSRIYRDEDDYLKKTA